MGSVHGAGFVLSFKEGSAVSEPSTSMLSSSSGATSVAEGTSASSSIEVGSSSEGQSTSRSSLMEMAQYRETINAPMRFNGEFQRTKPSSLLTLRSPFLPSFQPRWSHRTD